MATKNYEVIQNTTTDLNHGAGRPKYSTTSERVGHLVNMDERERLPYVNDGTDLSIGAALKLTEDIINSGVFEPANMFLKRYADVSLRAFVKRYAPVYNLGIVSILQTSPKHTYDDVTIYRHSEMHSTAAELVRVVRDCADALRRVSEDIDRFNRLMYEATHTNRALMNWDGLMWVFKRYESMNIAAKRQHANMLFERMMDAAGKLDRLPRFVHMATIIRLKSNGDQSTCAYVVCDAHNINSVDYYVKSTPKGLVNLKQLSAKLVLSKYVQPALESAIHRSNDGYSKRVVNFKATRETSVISSEVKEDEK